MKSSIAVTCHCGYQMTVQATGTQDIKDKQCLQCGTAIWFVNPLGGFVGERIFSRAWAELKNEDFTLVIVLSAMAIECELARLFIKWKEVDILDTRTPTPAEREAWAEQWRKWNAVAVRLDKVSTLLTGKDFDSFLSLNPALLTHIYAKYPTFAAYDSTKDIFVKEFFYKRNKVVHLGEIDFNQVDAEVCFTLAAALFQILKNMDDKRIAALDAKHAAQLTAPK